jgi:hypothetical protein
MTDSDQVVLNITYTDYEVVSGVAESLNWYCLDEEDEDEEEEEWDVLWTDFPLATNVLTRLTPE